MGQIPEIWSVLDPELVSQSRQFQEKFLSATRPCWQWGKRAGANTTMTATMPAKLKKAKEKEGGKNVWVMFRQGQTCLSGPPPDQILGDPFGFTSEADLIPNTQWNHWFSHFHRWARICFTHQKVTPSASCTDKWSLFCPRKTDLCFVGG